MRREHRPLRFFARLALVLALAAAASGCSSCKRAPDRNANETGAANTNQPAPGSTPQVIEAVADSTPAPPPSPTPVLPVGTQPTPTPSPKATPPPLLTLKEISGQPADQEEALAKLNEELAAAARKRGQIEGLHINLVMRTTNAQISKRAEVSAAEVRFRGQFNGPDSRLYVHSTTPAEVFATVHGDDVVTYRPKIKQVLTGKREELLKSATQLKELLNYGEKVGYPRAEGQEEEEAEGDEPEEQIVGGTYMVGTRRTKLLQEVKKKGTRVTKVSVWLDLETGLPVRVEKSANNVVQTIDFVKTVINPKPIPKEFEIDIPPDARRVKR